MADPLLTSLCSICHVSKPQYKCPRCQVRTCSLACVKKHKAWSECSGERDATAYVPRAKLRTEAGIDHDYNFLHGIETATERAERIIVGDKGIVQREELRPLTVQEVKWKVGKDGRRRRVLVTRVLREAKGRSFEKNLVHKLRKLNIEVLVAPLGMSRQKDNHTTLNRRTGRINWQVEWLEFEEQGDGDEEMDGEKKRNKTKRTLAKTMDDVPLYQAYRAALEDPNGTLSQSSKKTMAPGSLQNSTNSRWYSSNDSLQDPINSTWFVSQAGAALEAWPAEQEKARLEQFQFFLARQRTRSDLPTGITKLAADECLRDVLTNTRVLEFPTVYVLRQGEDIPAGYVLGPKDMASPQQSQYQGKRKGPAQVGQKGVKRRKPDGVMSREEGGVGSGEEGDGDRAETSEHEDLGPKEPGSLEAGEVIAEESMDEIEEDEEEDSDDETSSSGSDSE